MVDHYTRIGQAAEVLRWMIFDTGVPGELGQAAGLEGADRHGRRVTVAFAGGRAELQVHGEVPHSVSYGVLLNQMMEGDFNVSHVRVVRDWAPSLFKAAVREAQRALEELLHASSAMIRAEEEGGADRNRPGFWDIMAWHHQDETSPSAAISIVAGIATVEAQLNAWAARGGGWGIDEDGRDRDRLPLKDKCKLLPQLVPGAGGNLDFSQVPMQALLLAVKERDGYVHPKAGPTLVAVPGTMTPPVALTWARRAREVCSIVRESLILISQVLAVDAPRYLAMCPPTGPDDIEAWRTAILRTGSREDPVFPPIVGAA